MNLITISRLKKWEKEGNTSKLISCLQVEDTEIRKAICLILGDTKATDALLALRYIEENDEDAFVRLTARKSIEFMISNAYHIQQFQFNKFSQSKEMSYISLIS
jgi:hypothetical protein